MNDQTKWSDLLNRAVSEPGLILKAYSAFHGYSLSNQIAAMIQCRLSYVELKINDTQRRAIVLRLSSNLGFDHKPICAYRDAEFFRHRGIYRSDKGFSGSDRNAIAPTSSSAMSSQLAIP